MKKKPETVALVDVPDEGLISLLGKRVMLFCMRFHYAGVLEGVNESCVKLSNAQIVLDTGLFSNNRFADAQVPYKAEFYVQISSIQMFVELPF